MKRFILIFLISTGFVFASNAQELGIRFGDVTGGDVAVDALFSTSEFSMIHADVSFGRGGVGVDALWDFIYRPTGDIPLNWYLGVGPTVFLDDDAFALAASGEIGLAYNFEEVPISISADWRPAFVLVEVTDFYPERFGLNLRYVFQ